ncbi:hypothetical protein ACS0TY_029987 [Phlomoides rotata]
MEKKCADRRCEAPNFTEEEDDDEALSLSDLPLIHQPGKNREEEQGGGQEIEAAAVTHEEFDFCSFSKESEMCAADEVFFQGQILPLRHSISSDKGCSSRSESMDHYSSGRLISSRSSSTSSGSSSATGGGHISRSRLPPRNQFHSHPSPSPRLSFSNHNQRTNRRKSSVWNILRLGLVATPPEIALHDLKTRGSTTNCTNFGSRNSTSSNSSSVSSSKSNKKKKKGRGLLGGCKCSMDAVDTVASRVVIIKRSASENDVEALQRGRDQNVEEMKPHKLTKKHMSHHRTFEWLKQLSVEGTADES